jgi:oligopeptidase B
LILFGVNFGLNMGTAFGQSTSTSAPIAPQTPVLLEKHDDVRIDPYYWMKDRDSKPVLDYIKKENGYSDKVLAPLESLENKLFEEMKSRVNPNDSTLPIKKGEYFYYSKHSHDKEFPIYCRKYKSLNNPEKTILDANLLAKGKSFFKINNVTPSPNGEWIAFSIDSSGRNLFTIRFKNLKTGKLLKTKIENTTGELAWTGRPTDPNPVLYYITQDLKTLRSDTVRSIKISSNEREIKKSQIVYFEKDDTFSVALHKSLDQGTLFIETYSTLSTETYWIDANFPTHEMNLILPRSSKHEYQVDKGGDKFFVRSNDQAKNFRILSFDQAPTQSATNSEKNNTNNNDQRIEQWKEIIPHRDDVFIETFKAFKNHLVLFVRKGGLTQVEIFSLHSKKTITLEFPETAFTVLPHTDDDHAQKQFRIEYQSLATPSRIYDVELDTGKLNLVKEEEVRAGRGGERKYRASDYLSLRVWTKAPSEDGTTVEVPITLVYKKSLFKKSENPIYIESYGSYGISSDPYFSSSLISLLDRGFIYAIPHVRGGSEMGRAWYENGRQLKKRNTFTDFIASTEYLLDQGYGKRGKVIAYGGSAGGLLMGAIANMRPDLYLGIIAEVPFVDVVTTMLDPEIPLTTSEYDEWGNPNDKEYYHYMKSYSPYDNIEKKAYPHLLVVSGYQDSQVQYWEPLKWVAKLRSLKTDKNLLLLKMDLEAGHSGKAGRFEAMREVASKYSWAIGLTKLK